MARWARQPGFPKPSPTFTQNAFPKTARNTNCKISKYINKPIDEENLYLTWPWPSFIFRDSSSEVQGQSAIYWNCTAHAVPFLGLHSDLRDAVWNHWRIPAGFGYFRRGKGVNSSEINGNKCDNPTWRLIPLSKWVINGISGGNVHL